MRPSVAAPAAAPSVSRADLVALPKAELHLHLEGAIRPATARELADRYGRPMPRTGRFADLAEFVVAYEQARDLIGSLDDLRRVAAERSLELALAYRDRGVVGLGLAADEARFPASLFTDVFRRAADAGLPAVPHAGEGAGADSVRACVERLGARRINHGVRAVEDPAVVGLLVERGVSLDVCPSSNVALRVAPSLAEHPLPALLAAGVQVSLNTDCPLFLDTTTVQEYALASAAFGLDRPALAAVAETSLRSSSAPTERRSAALAALDEWRAAG